MLSFIGLVAIIGAGIFWYKNPETVKGWWEEVKTKVKGY